MDSTFDSIGSNFVEGYYAGSIKEYIRFLRYSRRSCADLQERVRRVTRKGYSSEDKIEKILDKIIKTGYLIDRLIYSLEGRKRVIEG
ncbi:four helix bundle protein [Patescibacteria group bacterium]|nr:four helix bundle protein [Patescibacteria group bacterium]MBU0963869.1 four helix bundle protein [Patescibacteria group bacterium]